MKNRVLLVFALIVLGSQTFAQEKKDAKPKATAEADTVAPYLKYPKLPAFNIRLMDSVTIFNTYNIPEGKKTILLYFSPECGHCQSLFRKLIKEMDSLKNVQIYLLTSVHDMGLLREFYKEYHLADYKNIKAAGRDYEFFFIAYYRIKAFPDMALYDEHKKLIKLFEGDIAISELMKYIR